MTEHKKDFSDFYLTAPQPCPYLAGRYERKLFSHLSRDKTASLVDHMLRNGFRRSQNIAYSPYCDACNACISVRIIVDKFAPIGSLKRVLPKNRDVVTKRVENVSTSEHYNLFRDYVDNRHADGGMADMSRLDFAMMVEDSSITTFLTEYRVRVPGSLPHEFARWPLVGVSLTDRLSDGLSLVYSFFDASEPGRSLGNFMILDNIQFARKLGLPYVYLGYWVEGSEKMNYKRRFKPQEMLTHEGWVPAD